MTAIRFFSGTGLLTLVLAASGCLEPAFDDIWTLDQQLHIQTVGYCRDIERDGTRVILGADQAGVEIWDLAAGNTSADFVLRIDSLTVTKQLDDVVNIGFSSVNNRLFVIENNAKVIPITLTSSDSFYADLETMSTFSKDLVVLDEAVPGIPDSAYILIVADRDDGLKVQSFSYINFFGVWGWYESGLISVELGSDGLPTGVDCRDSLVAMSNGQTGISLYQFAPDFKSITKLTQFDTPRFAEDVTLDPPYIYVSDSDGGMLIYQILASGEIQFLSKSAENLNVQHIVVSGDIAVLSLGSRGIALYDISDKSHPANKGIHDIGYTYEITYDGDSIYACTRDGLKIYRIQK